MKSTNLNRKRKDGAGRHRALRRSLCVRWIQLTDDLARLEEEIRNAPDGTFTERERAEALFGLSERVWDGMTNGRPKMPASTRIRN
jgi:hypothetical protein